MTTTQSMWRAGNSEGARGDGPWVLLRTPYPAVMASQPEKRHGPRVDRGAVSRPLSHRVWFRLLLLTLLMVPAIVEVRPAADQTPAVVGEVLREPYSVAVPWLLPVAKLALLIVVLLPFVGVRQSGRILLGYYTATLVLVAFFQNMGNTESFGFAWLIGNTLVQLLVAAWCLIDVLGERTRIFRGGLAKERLWVLLPMVLAFMMPYGVDEERITPALDSVLWNDAAVTYCMITPVVLGVLLLFPDGGDDRTLSVISFVGLLFGVINMGVWFVLNPGDWWMGVLHLPLVILAALGLRESRPEPRAGRHPANSQVARV